MKQYTDTILMVEPASFGFNEQTAVNNFFQDNAVSSKQNIQKKALIEFSAMVDKLRDHRINVIVLKDVRNPVSPDAVFPNNWVSFHRDGRMVVYPMFAANRRTERREKDLLNEMQKNGFHFFEIIDYSGFEKSGLFLEGTGSMVLDRVNRIAYAALSPRTSREMFLKFCSDFNYEPVYFSANQTAKNERNLIYHTNVMMCVADEYAVICLDSIDNPDERRKVERHLKNSRKRIIEISEIQMSRFAGNMLQLGSKEGKKYLVMSVTALQSLESEQIRSIEKFNPIISVDIPIIEVEGGSARCMIAEVFSEIEENE